MIRNEDFIQYLNEIYKGNLTHYIKDIKEDYNSIINNIDKLSVLNGICKCAASFIASNLSSFQVHGKKEGVQPLIKTPIMSWLASP